MTEEAPEDERLATLALERLAQAKAGLAARMDAAGLTAAQGWRITEDLRHTVDGTVWTFRPIHLHAPAVQMAAVVVLDERGRIVEEKPAAPE
jgi:hypothetical protein